MTTQGTVYNAYFLEYAYLFSEYPGIANDVFSFNLDIVVESIDQQTPDEKIGQTIAAIFHSFLTTKSNVVVYVCDSVDYKHLARKRKFDFWFWKYNDGSILKEDGLAVIAGIEIYNSLLVHKDNPLTDIIINAFRTLNERADDK